MAGSSAQPNATAHGRLFLYPRRFWLLVGLSGVGAGLAGGLLMRLLRVIEHAAYHYTTTHHVDAIMVPVLLATVVASLAAQRLSRLRCTRLRCTQARRRLRSSSRLQVPATVLLYRRW